MYKQTTALAPHASTVSYKGGEDCQFCAPILDRHKSFCTVGYVSSPAFAKGALSVPDAGADTTPGCLGDESDRYRLIKVRRQSALHLASTVDTVTVAYRAVQYGSSSKYQINAVKWLAQEGPFTKSRLTTIFPNIRVLSCSPTSAHTNKCQVLCCVCVYV